MSDWEAINSYGEKDENGNNEFIVCDCGCRFEIVVIKQAGHNEREEYYCPECNKKYFARAAMPIEVKKLSSDE